MRQELVGPCSRRSPVYASHYTIGCIGCTVEWGFPSSSFSYSSLFSPSTFFLFFLSLSSILPSPRTSRLRRLRHSQYQGRPLFGECSNHYLLSNHFPNNCSISVLNSLWFSYHDVRVSDVGVPSSTMVTLDFQKEISVMHSVSKSSNKVVLYIVRWTPVQSLSTT